MRFFVAAGLVNLLEVKQNVYQIDRRLAQLDLAELLVIDELGYPYFSCGGVELLFQLFSVDTTDHLPSNANSIDANVNLRLGVDLAEFSTTLAGESFHPACSLG